MATFLRQSTASQYVALGPFVDDTDGVTAETALTIANTDIKLHKSGATSLADKNSGGATHMANGIYYAALDATDTNTLGNLTIFCSVSGALPVWNNYVVLTAQAYDALVAGSDLTLFGIVRSGAIQAWSAGPPSTVTLDASASAGTDRYRGMTLLLMNAAKTTLYGTFVITAYNGTTKVATIIGYAGGASPGTPTSGDFFMIVPGVPITDLYSVKGSVINALQSGRMDSYIGAVASGVIAAASFAANALDAVWSTATRVLTAGTNISLAKGTGVTGLNDLDAAGVRTAVGLASANLDTQLDAIPTNTDLATALGGLNDITAQDVLDALLGTVLSGTAQGDGGSSDTIQLASGASGSDNTYNSQIIAIVGGAGKGQQRQIIDYTGSTKTAQVNAAWETAVDSTSVYIIFAN